MKKQAEPKVKRDAVGTLLSNLIVMAAKMTAGKGREIVEAEIELHMRKADRPLHIGLTTDSDQSCDFVVFVSPTSARILELVKKACSACGLRLWEVEGQMVLEQCDVWPSSPGNMRDVLIRLGHPGFNHQGWRLVSSEPESEGVTSYTNIQNFSLSSWARQLVDQKQNPESYSAVRCYEDGYEEVDREATKTLREMAKSAERQSTLPADSPVEGRQYLLTQMMGVWMRAGQDGPMTCRVKDGPHAISNLRAACRDMKLDPEDCYVMYRRNSTDPWEHSADATREIRKKN